MAEYTKDSLQKKLEEEAPKVLSYLKGAQPTEENIKAYYAKYDSRASKNAIKQMTRHLIK